MQMPDGGINESNEVIMFVSTPTKEQSMMDSGWNPTVYSELSRTFQYTALATFLNTRDVLQDDNDYKPPYIEAAKYGHAMLDKALQGNGETTRHKAFAFQTLFLPATF